mmetsp:Transcript_37552/g.98471  ORF Transcript_37552/g.98471 Transcript_37552/m.98471 type:complete len:83 (+) Transcript_37552:132-380(+)
MGKKDAKEGHFASLFECVAWQSQDARGILKQRWESLAYKARVDDRELVAGEGIRVVRHELVKTHHLDMVPFLRLLGPFGLRP